MSDMRGEMMTTIDRRRVTVLTAFVRMKAGMESILRCHLLLRGILPTKHVQQLLLLAALLRPLICIASSRRWTAPCSHQALQQSLSFPRHVFCCRIFC